MVSNIVIETLFYSKFEDGQIKMIEEGRGDSADEKRRVIRFRESIAHCDVSSEFSGSPHQPIPN